MHLISLDIIAYLCHLSKKILQQLNEVNDLEVKFNNTIKKSIEQKLLNATHYIVGVQRFSNSMKLCPSRISILSRVDCLNKR